MVGLEVFEQDVDVCFINFEGALKAEGVRFVWSTFVRQIFFNC